jgi:hypothetical protein
VTAPDADGATVTDLQLAELDTRHPPAVRRLAVHAALPAAVDPRLLHLLRDSFLLDGAPALRLPVTAESEAAMARLLLSPVFTPIDDELFEMAPAVRAALLRELETIAGGRRIAEVAAVLERYTLAHPTWPAELRWAQRVSCRVAADPQAVQEWLDEGARSGGGAGLDARWFAAMRTRVAQDRLLYDEPGRRERTGGTGPGEGAAVVPGPWTVVSLVDRSGSPLARALRLTSDGLYVTPAHVLGARAESLTAVTEGARGSRTLNVVAVDLARDVAFLRERRPAGKERPLSLAGGPGGDTRRDLRVLVAGTESHPTTVHPGAPADRYYRGQERSTGGPDLIRFDDDLVPGSSGGVLIDDAGSVVGMIVGAVADPARPQGIAVPAATVVEAMAAALDPAVATWQTAAEARLCLRVAVVAHGMTHLVPRPDQASGFAREALAVARATGDEALGGEAHAVLALVEAPAGGHMSISLPQDIASLVQRLEEVRSQPDAKKRIAARTPLVAEIRSRLQQAPPISHVQRDALLRSPVAAERVVGVVALEIAPEPELLGTLARMVDPTVELDHVASLAAVALRSAAELLPDRYLGNLEQAMDAALAVVPTGRRSNRAAVLALARAALVRRRATPRVTARRMPWPLWPNGTTLRVRFLDGGPALHEWVRALAQEWTVGTGIAFTFQGPTATGPADVRVTFTEGESSWSYLGTQARNVHADHPTMSLDTVRAGKRFRHEVLLEFGHALGLVSEHQQPHADLPWDLDALFRTYGGAPHHLTRENVEQTFLVRYEFPEPPRYRPFDPRSVMLHPFDPALFTGSFVPSLNTELSASDRTFIATLYPPVAAVRFESPPRVFLCYRRSDSPGTAGRLYDRLVAAFGADSVFMDLESLPVGADVTDALTEAVSSCHVVLAVIGQRWMTAADDAGVRPIDNPGDFVRIEIETALVRGVPVIPVLVDGAALPSPVDLPEALRDLASIQFARLSNTDFDRDSTVLINQIGRFLANPHR